MIDVVLAAIRHFIERLRIDPVEAYLSEAVDLYDLEFRFYQIDRGQAPFQQSGYSTW